MAGGLSRRFGSPKAFARYRDKHLYEYSVQALEKYMQRMVLVSLPSLTKKFKCNPVIQIMEDVKDYQGKGPLAGIYSVMKTHEADWYFVLPCDTPMITPEIIKKMISFVQPDIDAVVPVIHGKQQPLIAIYKKRVYCQIEQLLKQNELRMMSLYKEAKVRYITEKDLQADGREFVNINDMSSFQMLSGQKESKNRVNF